MTSTSLRRQIDVECLLGGILHCYSYLQQILYMLTACLFMHTMHTRLCIYIKRRLKLCYNLFAAYGLFKTYCLEFCSNKTPDKAVKKYRRKTELIYR